MRKWFLLLLLLAARPVEARLTEVKVWYYPPAGPPALIKHWVPGQLKVDRKFSYSRLGKFRVRVTSAPGDKLAIVFTDETGGVFDLPDKDRKSGGVKDVFWIIPYNFLTGAAKLQVKVLGGDQTEVMTLGTVTAR